MGSGEVVQGKQAGRGQGELSEHSMEDSGRAGSTGSLSGFPGLLFKRLVVTFPKTVSMEGRGVSEKRESGSRTDSLNVGREGTTRVGSGDQGAVCSIEFSECGPQMTTLNHRGYLLKCRHSLPPQPCEVRQVGRGTGI